MSPLSIPLSPVLRRAGALTALVALACALAAPVAKAQDAAAPVVAAAVASPAPAELGVAAAVPAAEAGLDARLEATKAEVIRLNRDLLALEEELLFPASTQVALFVSMDVGRLFGLDSVQLRLDDKLVANYLYTPLEVQALHRGGVQRVWLGNLRAGTHELVATFTGQGPHERDYKRGATLRFDKGSEPKYIELQIRDKVGKLQPEFEVKVWQ